MSSITLISPPDQSVTPPLQSHPWVGLPSEPGGNDNAYQPERSLPRPVSFTWSSPEPSGDGLRYDLLVSADRDFERPITLSDLKDTQAELPHLFLDTRYYWKVIQRRGGQVLAESPVWTFQTNAEPPRWIHVPGTSNVRDIGGWRTASGQRVRQGLLYRSAELNTHLQITPEGALRLIEELGIRTDLDLRGIEGDEDPQPALDPARVDWINVRLAAYGTLFSERGRPGVRQAFQVLADPARYPILVHCWGGADRTGSLIFLVNALLGVSLPDLGRDYELTSYSIMALRRQTSPEFQELVNGLKTFAPDGAGLQTQVEGFLQSVGVTAGEIQTIRQILLEDEA